MYRQMFSVLLLFFVSACRTDEWEPSVPSQTGEDQTYSITVHAETPDDRGQMKSSFSSADLSRITDLNVFIYHQGRLLDEYCRYFDDISSLMLTFPYDKDGFNIYMVGNVGILEAPEEESEISKMSHVIDSYDDFYTRGVPVANVFSGYRKGTLAHFGLKMLLGRYNISVRTSASDSRYIVKDVRLLNCAMDVYPFNYDTGAFVFAVPAVYDEEANGDVLTAEDIEALNAGEKVTLYFVENVQGELLPGNTDRRKKIPSSLNGIDKGLADRCTYIEITADIVTPGAEYTDGKFRFYLGQNETTDFSVRRSTSYDVTLDFTQNMVDEEEWRIEVGDPEVVGVSMDKEEAMVIKGTEDRVYVQAYDNNGNLMDFDAEVLSSNGYVNVEKVITNYLEDPHGSQSLAFCFTSNLDITGLYPYDSEPTYRTETVRISSRETYNGRPLYSKDIKVRVYDKLFPLLIKLEKKAGASAYSVVLRGQNPMQLGLSVAYNYVYDGVSVSQSKTSRGRFRRAGTLYSQCIDNVAGVSFSTLNSSVTPSNLSRIDFTVRGFTTAPAVQVMYPKVLSSDMVFVGDGSQAYFGPGGDMYPQKYDDLSEDEAITMGYRDYGYSLGYSNVEWTAWSSGDDYSSTLNLTQTPPFDSSSGFRYNDFYSRNGSKVFFQFGDDMGVHIPSHGRFVYDDHGFQKENEEKYSAVPFYFVNAGLTLFYTHSEFHYKRVTWPSEDKNGFEFRMYGPGRDLFSENRTGGALNNVHQMSYWMLRWKNLVGKTQTEQSSQSYSGQLYMTINSASAWTGCDTSEYGYFTGTY